MDDHLASPHRKTSLPTFTSSIPVEIAVLPASTRTSFTRVENNTRPGTAAGDNIDVCDVGAVPGGGGGGSSSSSSSGGGAPAPPAPPEGGPEEVVPAEAAAVIVPQVPQTLVQFLLVSGRRRSMAFVPETTVGRVKELVWNSWPNGTSATFPLFPSLSHSCTSHPMSPITPARSRKGPGRPTPFFYFLIPFPSGFILIFTFHFFSSRREFCDFDLFIYMYLLSP